MGTYLNPTPILWQEALNSEIYVDKTGLINYTNSVINTKQKYLCVSRPRRFGKTMAMNMLAAYYDCTTDARELFKGLEISGVDCFASEEEVKKAKEKAESAFDKYANKFNVLHFNMLNLLNEVDGNIRELIKYIKRIIMHELSIAYPQVVYFDKSILTISLNEAYQQTGMQFIILIDEWDAIFREYHDDKNAQKAYLDFLRAWLKDQPYVALAYMTGILPIKKYGKHSALNMFEEYSMEDQGQLEEFTGFTDEDVKVLCSQYEMDYTQCKAWYNGYKFIKYNAIYNPLSVVKSMRSRQYKNYWTKTETFEALKVYIDMNYDGLKESILKLMAGSRHKIDTSNFANDMVTFESEDEVMALLIHLGYLGYDSESREVFIPNNEIRTEFAAAVKNSKSYVEVAKAIKNADELLDATIAGDSDKVAELIQTAHVETSHLQYNDENALSYTISLAYYTARNKYNVIREMPTGKGFADMVFLPLPHHPEMPPILVELKWDKTADTAIKQIKDKNYLECLKGFEGNIILVGVNYDKTTRKHTCVIEKG